METKDWNNVSIDELPGLSVRALNYLKNQEEKTVGELIDLKTLGNPHVYKKTPIPYMLCLKKKKKSRKDHSAIYQLLYSWIMNMFIP